MKKLTIILFALLIPFVGMAQEEDAISKFLGKYVNDEDFSTVYITKRMFRLIAQIADDPDEKEFEETINKIESFCILSTEKRKGRELYQEIASKLPMKEYEELMIIREGKDLTKFLIKETKEGKILELLMLSGSENKFSILSMTGEINLDQISKLSKKMEIDGLDKLKGK
ncbi:MAG: hypothetical protein ACJAWV_003555 [Flammeovirgaceae bacterium]|jgi:hypothetical protein